MTKRWKAGWLVLLWTSAVPAEPAWVCQGNPGNLAEPYGVDLDDILAMLAAMSGQVCQYSRLDTDFPDPDCPWDLCSNNCEGVPSVDVDDLLAVLLAFQSKPWGSICSPITCPPDTNDCRPVADAGPDVDAYTGEALSLTAGYHLGSHGLHSIRWDFGVCMVGLRDPLAVRFMSAGTYPITLLIADLGGRVDTDTVAVHVTDPLASIPLVREIKIILPASGIPATEECPNGYKVYLENSRKPRKGIGT